jgi:hypothetical protein
MLDCYFTKKQEKVWLGTAFNTRAENFYRKAGCTEVGILDKNEIKFEMNFDDWKKSQNC